MSSRILEKGETYFVINDKIDSIFVQEDMVAYVNKDGFSHREDGPAIITPNYIVYRFNGKLHRTNGPAVEYKNLSVFPRDPIYYYHGKRVSENELNKLVAKNRLNKMKLKK